MRTEVPKFGVVQASSVSNAISLLAKYGPNATLVSGGTDLLYQLKNNVTTTVNNSKTMIDISGLNLSYINYSSSDGFRIGATTHNNDIATDTNVNTYAPVLAQAASSIATLQLRNMGTVGGDVLQQVWCPYLRNNFACWRNGGNLCYAVIGENRYFQSIFGARLTFAVHAGDMAPALFALNAEATIQGPDGTRTASMDQLMPGISVIGGIVKENTLGKNEILTEFHVPAPPANQQSTYYKVRERGTWDFALASAAVALNFAGSTVTSARIVLGGVDVVPHRANSAESYLSGQQLSESVIAEAASKALDGSTPLTTGTGNAFRVQLAIGAVTKALRALS